MAHYELFDLGDLRLAHGGLLPSAQLAYAAHGTLNAERSNVVVIPSAYGGTHADSAWLIGPGAAFDPARWFVIATNLFGNGLSTSPSQRSDIDPFPYVSVYDNVRAAHRLVTERFGVTKVALVTGFSMGAQQSFHWACAFPGFVERIVPVCGSARTSAHNRVFLDGAIATLETAGAATLGRIWAAWGLSQAFYRKELWRELGSPTLEAFVDEWYGPAAFASDPRDLRAMFATWRGADISDDVRFNGDFTAALGSIVARAVVVPSRSDTYFPPEDSEIEVRHLVHADLRVIPSDWGHAAGAGVNAPDNAFIEAAIRDVLLTESES